MFFKAVLWVGILALALTVITGNLAVPLVVGAVFAVGAGFIPWGSRDSRDDPPPAPKRRCPHCGSPVTIRGSRWECGWCGDHGDRSSLK